MRKAQTGLTLIEVLIIVVMIGILLTIALQKIRSRGTPDVGVSLRADIESVRDAEAKYFSAHNAFATAAQLDSIKVLTPSAGNSITVKASVTSFSATAKNDADPANPRSCTIEVTGGEKEAAKAQPVCN